MDYKTIFTYEVLPYIEKLSISLKKCSRCKKEYEKSKFKFDTKKNCYFKNCVTCQEKQSAYRKNKEIDVRVNKEYDIEENKEIQQVNEKDNQESTNIIKCSRCKKDYGEDKFKFNEKKQTFSKQCILCQEKQMKHVMNHYNKNKEKDEYREKLKEYREKHRQTDAYKQYCDERKKDEKVQERKRIVDREWKKNNPEKVKEQARKSYRTYYAKHKDTEEYKERRRLNRSKPEIKDKSKEYYSRPETKERRNLRQNTLRKEDPRVALRQNVARRINKALNCRNSSKTDNTVKYLGCSIDFFAKHLEKQFKDGMSWDNYGRKSGIICWEIDHKIPINYEDPDLDEVKKRLHYTNCQPMWAEENRSKSNKYIG